MLHSLVNLPLCPHAPNTASTTPSTRSSPVNYLTLRRAPSSRTTANHALTPRRPPLRPTSLRGDLADESSVKSENTLNVTQRRSLLLASATSLVLQSTAPAHARLVTLELSDLDAQVCANPIAAGVPGSSTYKAKCYEVVGTVYNKNKSVVSNADVYGQIFDAAKDPVLRSGRVGTIQNVPPGKSTFRLEITIAASQPLPLTFKNFKGQGFEGVVNRSGNPYDMDYTVGTFPGGTKGSF